MNSGKTVFAQIMQLIPRREFNEIVTRYKGDYRVRNLSLSRYNEILRGKTKGTDIITNRVIPLAGELKINAKEVLILEM